MVERNAENESKAVDVLIDLWDAAINSMTICIMDFTTTGDTKDLCGSLQSRLDYLDVIERALKRLATPLLRVPL